MTLLSDALPYKITINPGVAIGASSPWTPQTVPLPIDGVATPSAQQHVTVHDVLVGLYTFLRIPLTPAEYAVMPPALQQVMSAAFHRRIGRIADPVKQKLEHDKGLKRIDHLLATGKTRFVGLGATKKGNDIWVLNLA
jgi:hypothetical protein